MRIEAYSNVQQVYQTQVVGKNEKSHSPGCLDQVEISSMGKDIQVTKTALENVPDVREELVASIKARMDSGTYEVSSEKFAEKLLGQLEGMR